MIRIPSCMEFSLTKASQGESYLNSSSYTNTKRHVNMVKIKIKHKTKISRTSKEHKRNIIGQIEKQDLHLTYFANKKQKSEKINKITQKNIKFYRNIPMTFNEIIIKESCKKDKSILRYNYHNITYTKPIRFRIQILYVI